MLMYVSPSLPATPLAAFARLIDQVSFYHVGLGYGQPIILLSCVDER